MIYFECSLQKRNIIPDSLAKIDEWINSVAMRGILETFGAKVPTGLSTEGAVEWLLQFSDEWDYRKKQQTAYDIKTKESARWLVRNNEITQEQERAVFAGIAELGLIDVKIPLRKDYNYVIALGGARLSCLLRPKYAKEVIDKYSLEPSAVVMLSGLRPISDSEREATDKYARGAKTEYDLICAGAEQCFQLTDYDEEYHKGDNINSSWAVRTYMETPPVISISGPSTEPTKRRANSADTFKFFYEKFNVKKGAKLLFITSQIYVPYQQLEAIRTLSVPHGIMVETIGFPREWTDHMQGMQQASNYLQEIRSVIQAMNRFIEITKNED